MTNATFGSSAASGGARDTYKLSTYKLSILHWPAVSQNTANDVHSGGVADGKEERKEEVMVRPCEMSKNPLSENTFGVRPAAVTLYPNGSVPRSELERNPGKNKHSLTGESQ